MKKRTPTEDGRKVWLRILQTHPHIQTDALRHCVSEKFEGEVLTVFTCCDCPVVKECEYAYDLYNTDGDCLALK